MRFGIFGFVFVDTFTASVFIVAGEFCGVFFSTVVAEIVVRLASSVLASTRLDYTTSDFGKKMDSNFAALAFEFIPYTISIMLFFLWLNIY